MNQISAAKLALTLGRHFGEDVAFVSVFALVASRRFLEAFRCSAMYLDLWHFLTPHWEYLSVKQQAEVFMVNG
jgi:hypothetical protein